MEHLLWLPSEDSWNKGHACVEEKGSKSGGGDAHSPLELQKAAAAGAHFASAVAPKQLPFGQSGPPLYGALLQ